MSSLGPVVDHETPREQQRIRGERGSAVFELPLVVGLVLLPFALLVLLVPTWVERQTAARDAAGEVARAAVVSGAGSDFHPDTVLSAVERAHGLAPGSLDLVDYRAGGPGDPVTVQVSVLLPGRDLPVFGSLLPSTWTTEHSERWPDYAVRAG